MSKHALTIARGAGVIGVTMALMVGATFAALSGPTATLQGNTLATASTNLQISLDNITYSSSVSGFHLTDVIPGTDTPGAAFDLQCTGGIPQNITANIPVTPTFSGLTDFSGVVITFTPTSGPAIVTNMAALLAGQVTFDSCNGSGAVQTYTPSVNISKTVVTGSSMTIGSFDIVFTGTES